MQTGVFDVTGHDFQTVVAQGSVTKPVMVVFWSNQCNICKTLLPQLEKLHKRHNNSFTLARVNCEIEYQIVQHFEIKSVPTVYMFVDGQGVDGFAGEQTVDFINDFINKYVPDATALLVANAQTLLAQGELLEAKNKIIEAQQVSPDDNHVKLLLAQVYLSLGEFEHAKPILNNIPLTDQNIIYHNLMSELELIERSSHTPEIIALEQQLTSAEHKQPIQFKLSIQYYQTKRFKEALHLLYTLLCLDLGYEDGEAKKLMLDILATIEDQSLVSEYRRKLYSLLY
jgi:putative thioredoxin